MDYDKFLSYAFPAFGIALLVALLTASILYLIAKRLGDNSPKWMAYPLLILVVVFFIACAAMILIGWLLPWGSPF